MICRHCGNPKRKVNRPRGLCYRCYYSDGVRVQYGMVNFNGQISDVPVGRIKPASRPTKARPGTAEKIAILTERASRGESLWHPDDHVVNVNDYGRDDTPGVSPQLELSCVGEGHVDDS